MLSLFTKSYLCFKVEKYSYNYFEDQTTYVHLIKKFR